MKKKTIGAAAIVAGAALAYKRRKDYFNKYDVLPEYKNVIRFTFPDFVLNKKCMNIMNRNYLDKIKQPKGVILSTRRIPTYDGAKILLNIMEPEDVREDEILPCLVYYHGGAYMIEAGSVYYDIMADYVKNVRCKVIFPHYRTIYNATTDGCFEDAYAALSWTSEHADILHIDKERIAVGGDSAGGGLTAAVTHMARDRKGPKTCFQMLFYPVVDGTLGTESMKKYTDTLMWNAKANKKLWSELRKTMSSSMENYVSSLSNPDFSGLCNAYIEIEEFDCLHDEGKLYAEKLIENGYEVELNDVKGTFHGYDQYRGKLFTKQIIELRVDRLKKAFTKSE